MTASGTRIIDPVSEVLHDEFWIFGYGSLIFKPPPEVERAIPGYISGYVRRFWQKSHDHRGTETAPGRVVTLVEKEFWETLEDPHSKFENPKLKTWGIAYKIKAGKVPEVSAALDLREQNGYTVHLVPFNPLINNIDSVSLGADLSFSADSDAKPRTILSIVYIGTPDNEAFAGVQDIDELAAHILKSNGISGSNKEYLYKLGEALQNIHGENGEEDDYHVRDLVEKVKALELLEQSHDIL
ncbi:ChaC-like protein [Lipomyces japonicus]|uniref:ChaC-like protein n=1 Tax=Lipomyces japonicus TaxID=56871 RepID=UPI0034CDE4C2